MPTVEIPKVGNVDFPDEMKPEEVEQAAGELHDRALLSGVMKFVAQDPSLQDLKASDFHKQLATVSALLEKFPRLAQAIDAGMGNVPDASQSGTPSAASATQEPQEPAAPEDGSDQT